jgi:hypothetical protein
LAERVAVHPEFFVDDAKQVGVRFGQAALEFAERLGVQVDRALALGLVVIVLVDDTEVVLVVALQTVEYEIDPVVEDIVP